MKTQKLIAAIIIFFSTTGLYAQNGNKVSEVKNSPAKKEYIVYNKQSGDCMYKTTYEYGSNNLPTNRITYVWSKMDGWVESSIHEYRYNDQKQITNVFYTKWNKVRNQWSDKMYIIINQYDDNGKLLYTEHAQVNKKDQSPLLSAY